MNEFSAFNKVCSPLQIYREIGVVPDRAQFRKNLLAWIEARRKNHGSFDLPRLEKKAMKYATGASVTFPASTVAWIAKR